MNRSQRFMLQHDIECFLHDAEQSNQFRSAYIRRHLRVGLRVLESRTLTAAPKLPAQRRKQPNTVEQSRPQFLNQPSGQIDRIAQAVFVLGVRGDSCCWIHVTSIIAAMTEPLKLS
jgi:hypothetical protein